MIAGIKAFIYGLLQNNVLEHVFVEISNMLSNDVFRAQKWLSWKIKEAIFISKGFISMKWQWKRKFGKGCKVIASQKLGFLQYKFYDKKGIEIDL